MQAPPSKSPSRPTASPPLASTASRNTASFRAKNLCPFTQGTTSRAFVPIIPSFITYSTQSRRWWWCEALSQQTTIQSNLNDACTCVCACVCARVRECVSVNGTTTSIPPAFVPHLPRAVHLAAVSPHACEPTRMSAQETSHVVHHDVVVKLSASYGQPHVTRLLRAGPIALVYSHHHIHVRALNSSVLSLFTTSEKYVCRLCI